MMAMDMRAHDRLVFESADSALDCRMDGTKYVSKRRTAREHSAWAFLRNKPPKKPTLEEQHTRKVTDSHIVQKMANIKVCVESRLPGHIQRYREHRVKHPNHLPPPNVLTDQRNFAISHNKWVGRATYAVNTKVEAWCVARMTDKANLKFTRAGSIKRHLVRQPPRPLTAMQLRHANNQSYQTATDQDLLPPKRGKPDRAMAASSAVRQRPHTVPCNIGRRDPGWSSQEDLLEIVAHHGSHDDLTNMMAPHEQGVEHQQQEQSSERRRSDGLEVAQRPGFTSNTHATITHTEFELNCQESPHLGGALPVG